MSGRPEPSTPTREGEVIETIALSRAYTIEVARAAIGNSPAIALRMRHTPTDGGPSTIRGGFQIHLDRLERVIDAMTRAMETLEDEDDRR